MTDRRKDHLAAGIRLAMFLVALGTFATPAVAAGDPAAGERLFNQCKACHQVGEGARNRAGPILNGIVGGLSLLARTRKQRTDVGRRDARRLSLGSARLHTRKQNGLPGAAF